MKTENEDSFNTELFIEEIHKLPCIWDYTSTCYNNRIEKDKSWESLCSKFYDNFEVKDEKEKSECAAKLQRKWRSLRDSYNRDFKKNYTLKCGSVASKRRQYIYFNNLYFLKPLAERRATESSINDSQQTEDEDDNSFTQMATEKEDFFDTELFIEEIHKLPCIWDYTSTCYSNRIEKDKAWECLCSKFYDNFEVKDENEKIECATKLQRKWRTLRDSYNRDFKKNYTLKSSSVSSKRRQYIYFNNLYFLKPLAERRATENSINNSQQNEDEDDQSFTQNSINESRKVTKRKITKNTDQENELIKKLLSPLTDCLSKEHHPMGHTDSDMHFLLSLYDRFKAIDSRLKLQAQIEIVNVIQKYDRLHTSIHD